MRRFVASLATCAALAAFALVLAPASAAQTWEDVSTQTALAALDSAPRAQTVPNISGKRLAAPVRPDAGAPPFLISFISAGYAETGVPCFGCVSGTANNNNIGLTAPYNYITTGEVAQYTTAFTDLSNTGDCTFSWAIAAGKTKLDSWSYVFKGVGAYGSYALGFNRNRPSYSGAAILTSKIACVGNGSLTAKVSLYYQ